MTSISHRKKPKLCAVMHMVLPYLAACHFLSSSFLLSSCAPVSIYCLRDNLSRPRFFQMQGFWVSPFSMDFSHPRFHMIVPSRLFNLREALPTDTFWFLACLSLHEKTESVNTGMNCHCVLSSQGSAWFSVLCVFTHHWVLSLHCLTWSPGAKYVLLWCKGQLRLYRHFGTCWIYLATAHVWTETLGDFSGRLSSGWGTAGVGWAAHPCVKHNLGRDGIPPSHIAWKEHRTVSQRVHIFPISALTGVMALGT